MMTTNPSAMHQHLRQKLLDLFPAFRALAPEVLDEVLRSGQLRQAPRGTVLFHAHSPCRGFPMLLEGEVRVSKLGAQGRELELYRVRPGESCVISSACLLGRQDYGVTGIAATDVTLFFLPPNEFNALIASEQSFRDYVFGLFSARLAEVMELVEAVAFQKLDQRLAALLLEECVPADGEVPSNRKVAAECDVLRITHQQIADRLGSVREIVGRLLRSFEDRGLVALSREQIRLLDRQGLREIAQRAGYESQGNLGH